jgi:cAMP-dependent protein kinase regulator
MTMLQPTVELLRKVPVLGGLSNNELQRILDAPENMISSFAPREVIFAEGDVADCMYIVLDGAVDVRIRSVGDREITIANIKPGEYFGEQALMPGSSGRRNASVRSLTRCTAFRISGSRVAAGMEKVERSRANAMDPSQSVVEQVRGVVRACRLFRSLSAQDLDRVNEWTTIEEFDEGDIILREDEPGVALYLVLGGSVEAFAIDGDGKLVVLGRMSKGQYFGEQALLADGSGTHNVSVRAETRATLVKVSKRYFVSIVNHDEKLLQALKAVGEAQRKKKIDAIGQDYRW